MTNLPGFQPPKPRIIERIEGINNESLEANLRRPRWNRRAVMSLARLRRDQGKRDEARELLAPVYGWFTEGFDTRDLKDAKVLLDELAA